MPADPTYVLCCVRYIEHSAQCIGEWQAALEENDPPAVPTREAYRESIADTRAIIQRIYAGMPCPWHNGVPESYLHAMRLLEPR